MRIGKAGIKQNQASDGRKSFNTTKLHNNQSDHARLIFRNEVFSMYNDKSNPFIEAIRI